MTADIRAAAQREAETRTLHEEDRNYRYLFVEGAAWAAARVTPTRDEVADTLAGAYDEWCLLLEEFLAGRGADPGSEYEYKANAVLALLRSNRL